jgi:hypothetical protein
MLSHESNRLIREFDSESFGLSPGGEQLACSCDQDEEHAFHRRGVGSAAA